MQAIGPILVIELRKICLYIYQTYPEDDKNKIKKHVISIHIIFVFGEVQKEHSIGFTPPSLPYTHCPYVLEWELNNSTRNAQLKNTMFIHMYIYF